MTPSPPYERATAGPSDEADQDQFDNQTNRTVATNVREFRYEYGRRYHAYREGAYFQPNDSKHNEHEAIAHHLFLLSLQDRLTRVPVGEPGAQPIRRVLDIGTGTGRWAIDFGEKFPDTEVIATDLSPVQLNSGPPNVKFEVDDCNSEWIYDEGDFDFIHVRQMAGSVADWPGFYSKAFRHLASGGYFEHIDFSPHIGVEWADPTAHAEPVPESDVMRQWGNYLVEAGRKMGKNMDITQNMKGWMEAAGFTEIIEQTIVWPIGPWHSDPNLRDLGTWNLQNWDLACEGWLLAPATRQLGWSYEEVQKRCKESRTRARDSEVHCSVSFKLVCGRKP